MFAYENIAQTLQSLFDALIVSKSIGLAFV